MNAEVKGLPKVLVVDDHKENLVAMRHILAGLGGEVVCVDSGNEALKQLLRNEFAVVLMDVQMPEMNGFETAELIRTQSETKNLPIIFLTAINKEERYVEQGYKLGAVDYLFKPFDSKILCYKVSVFMDLYQQRSNFLEAAKKNKLILDSVTEGVVGLDCNGHIIFINPAADKLLKIKNTQAIEASPEGSSFLPFIESYSDHTAWKDTEIYRTCVIDNSIFCKSDLTFRNHDGDIFPVECTVSPMQSSRGSLEGFVLAFKDISERLRTEQQLAQLAEYDPLTGLANRRLFYRMLPKLLAKAKRLQNNVALLFIDIDHFKTINDTLGHVVGDLLLAQVAARLQSCVRESDTVVRLGGDEFTIVLEGEMNRLDVEKIATNLIQKIDTPFRLNNNNVHCSASIGIAMTPDVEADTNELIKAADIAMFSAKDLGRNTYRFYDDSLDKQASFRTQIEAQIPKALANDEFRLVYQPKIDIETGRLKGFESLLRWNSSSIGNVSPSLFIPIAEDCGRINEVGLWVFQQSCQQLKQWHDSDLLYPGFKLSVNFSTKQLNNPDFLLYMDKTLNEVGVHPSYIDIEITETTLMTNPDAIVPLLRVLSELGMSISVDDFGTGYSSLNYLKLLPIHVLKIDQSFIRDLFRNSNSEIITRSIINLAHNLGLEVVAEGIETIEQKDFLQSHNCDYGQGYLYGKPGSPDIATTYFNQT